MLTHVKNFYVFNQNTLFVTLIIVDNNVDKPILTIAIIIYFAQTLKLHTSVVSKKYLQ